MRFILIVFFILTSPLHQTLYGAEEKSKTEAHKVPIPNPLELQADWWNYFTVPLDDLPEKIEAFQKNLDNLLSVTEEEHPEIIQEKQNIFQNLELYKKTISQVPPKDPPPLQVLQSYTLSQILDLNSELLRFQNEITQMHDKISFESTRLSWDQSKLDKNVLQYYNLSGSSYEKLVLGLKIIELKLEVAIHKAKTTHYIAILHYLQKEKELLTSEFKNARNKITYSNLDKQTLVQEWETSQKNLEKAQVSLTALEKKESLQDTSNLKGQIAQQSLYYKIITETINIQNLSLLSMINEVKLILYNISQNEKEAETDKIQVALKTWAREINNAKQFTQQWSKQLEGDHSQISKALQDKVKERPDNSAALKKAISEIHLEIDKSFDLIEEIRLNISSTEFLVKLVEKHFIDESGFSESWTIRLKANWSKFIDSFEEKINFSLFYVKDRPISAGTFLKAILTIFLAILFSKFFRRILFTKIFSTVRISKSTKYIILRIVHYIIVIIAFLIALSFVGLDLTNIAIALGVLGVGIGFGLQGMVNNIISGFTILLHRHLKVGDIVDLNGELGTILDMSLQFTHITTFDGASQVIPNSEVFHRGLKNWTMHNPYRRYRIPFHVEYGTDKNFLKKIITEAVKEEPYVLSGFTRYGDPDIWFTAYGENSLDFMLIAWVNLDTKMPNGNAISSLLWVIDNVLAKHNITIPFTRRDLYIKEKPKEIDFPEV